MTSQLVAVIRLLLVIFAISLLIPPSGLFAQEPKCGDWKLVPDATNSGWLESVSAITDSDVWAVGFDRNGSGLGLIEHWDGNMWSRFQVPSDPNYLIGELHAVKAISHNDVWAVGRAFSLVDGSDVALHWDGTAWNIVPLGNQGIVIFKSLSGVATNDLWMLGSQGEYVYGKEVINHWNGQTWQNIPVKFHQSQITQPMDIVSGDYPQIEFSAGNG